MCGRALAAVVVDRRAFVLGQLGQAVLIGSSLGRRGHGQEACGSQDRDQPADIFATLHIVLSASVFVVISELSSYDGNFNRVITSIHYQFAATTIYLH